MLAQKPIMGWNSWNTFGKEINEELILQTADAIVEQGYLDAGYEYIIIDDCWSLKERVNGKLVANPEIFPHGMKYISDYLHSKGLKFGMYSCSGFKTCAGYPSSHGYEYEDAAQFAQWGVDYLKYDYCNFPKSLDTKNAYLTMSMALRSCGRDIVFAACNFGEANSPEWMRSHGAHTFRSTNDIYDTPESFFSIFERQYDKVNHNAPGCYNDMDMLIVGMHGNGNVGLEGCTTQEYLLHFAMWAFLGSPLIIGGDIRNFADEDKAILLNKHLISINQDDDCRPPFVIDANGRSFMMAKLLSKGKFAIGCFNIREEYKYPRSISFDDLGIHSNTNKGVHLIDALTGEDMGVHTDGLRFFLHEHDCRVFIGEICNLNE